jgi:hypothetical protein
MKKISTNLDSLNTSTSSMETMPIEINPISKYVYALPQRRWPWGGGHKFGWAFGHLGRECLPRGAELTSWQGECAFIRE